MRRFCSRGYRKSGLPGQEEIAIEDGFSADEAGNVFKPCGKLQSVHYTDFGYARFSYKKRGVYVHRLVWRYFNFIGISKDKVIDHIDRNPSNPKLANLRCVTHKENSANANKKGFRWQAPE